MRPKKCRREREREVRGKTHKRNGDEPIIEAKVGRIVPYSSLLGTSLIEHSLFAETASDIVVTWSTKNLTNSSIVEYGIGRLNSKAVGSTSLFVDGGKERRAQYIHRVQLSNLAPGETYCMYNNSLLRQ